MGEFLNKFIIPKIFLNILDSESQSNEIKSTIVLLCFILLLQLFSQAFINVSSRDVSVLFLPAANVTVISRVLCMKIQ